MQLKPRLFRKPNLSHPLARGLVGYWAFNEYSGTVINDLSGNGGYGTITGAPWVGGGLWFADNTDGVVIPHNEAFVSSPDFTVSLWVNKLVTSTLYNNNWGIAKWNLGFSNDNNAWGLVMTESGGDDNFGLIVRVAGSELSLFSTNEMPLNEKVMLTGVRNGDMFSLYLDGLLVDSSGGYSTAAITDNSNYDVYIARSKRTTLKPDCIVYGAQFHNRALSAEEIQSLYINPNQLFQEFDPWLYQSGGAPPSGLSIPIAMHHYKMLRSA